MTYSGVILGFSLLSFTAVQAMEDLSKTLPNSSLEQEAQVSIPKLRSLALEVVTDLLVEEDTIKGIHTLDLAQQIQDGTWSTYVPHPEELRRILAIPSVDVFREHNKPLVTLQHEPSDYDYDPCSPNAFALSPNGKKLAVSTKRLTIWDMNNLSGEPVILEGPLLDADETALRWSQDGTKIYVCKRGTLLCWDVNTQKLLYFYVVDDRHQADIPKMYAFSPDGKYLLGVRKGPRCGSGKFADFPAYCSGVLYELDSLPDGEIPKSEHGQKIELPHQIIASHTKTWLNHFEIVGSRLFLSFSPNGKYAVTAGCDFTLRLHDISALPTIETICYEHKGTVTAVAFSPDGNTMITATNEIRPWNVEKTDEKHNPVQEITAIYVWNVKGKTCKKLMDYVMKERMHGWPIGDPRFPYQIAFDGRMILFFVGYDHKPFNTTIFLYDLKSDECYVFKDPLKNIRGKNDRVIKIALSPDGNYVFMGGEYNTLHIFSLLGPAATLTLPQLLLVAKYKRGTLKDLEDEKVLNIINSFPCEKGLDLQSTVKEYFDSHA